MKPYVVEMNLPDGLIPAHAGVILSPMFSKYPRPAYPRARGGDPSFSSAATVNPSLSPRTRG